MVWRRGTIKYRTRLSRRDHTDLPPDSLSDHPVWEPYRISHRLKFARLGVLSGGVIVDKDSGEPAIADYVGGFLAADIPNWQTRIVVGDVRWGVGTGLVFPRRSWSP